MTEFIRANNHLGFASIGLGVGASVLTVLQYLTPIIGVVAALFGFIAGWVTLRIKIAEWKEWQKDHPESKKYHRYDEDDKYGD